MRHPMAHGSLAAKSRFESCVPRSGNGFFRKLCSSGSTRRKPLFPPPQETMINPVTNQPRKKRLANKGRQPTHVLCVNGRIVLQRRWWHSSVAGSTASADTLIDRRGQTVTCGVIEMAARLNNDGTSFAAAAQNLARTAQVALSGEQLRKLVIAAGQSVLAAQRSTAISTAFQAEECPDDSADPSGPTRLYTGVDGVMVPTTITDAEKVKRRTAIKRKRQRSRKKCRPLPPRRKGTDEKFKEFKVVTFYDETGKHWHEVLTRGRWHTVGALVRRGFATNSKHSRANYRWTGWGWTSTTSPKMCTTADGSCSVPTRTRAARGRRTCCTHSSTRATNPPGSSC